MKYTIIFLKFQDEILMLNRQKSPNMGLWNGVGGKIENGETISDSAIREVREETGIIVDSLEYIGDVFWISENDREGMHIFLKEFDVKPDIQTPVVTPEGILDWKKIDWILNGKNLGVVENIHYFLPSVLSREKSNHYFYYQNHSIVDYKNKKSVFLLDKPSVSLPEIPTSLATKKIFERRERILKKRH